MRLFNVQVKKFFLIFVFLFINLFLFSEAFSYAFCGGKPVVYSNCGLVSGSSYVHRWSYQPGYNASVDEQGGWCVSALDYFGNYTCDQLGWGSLEQQTFPNFETGTPENPTYDPNDPPPEPLTCPLNQHEVLGICVWNDTICPGGDGWYPDQYGICHPSTQEQCGPGYTITGSGGYCIPDSPDSTNCPLNYRYNPELDICQWTGEYGTTESDPLPMPVCSPTVPEGWCIEPSVDEPIKAPPFCVDVVGNTDPNLECRGSTGEQEAPPLVDENGDPLPPPKPGEISYSTCGYPLPLCHDPSYSCTIDNFVKVVPACQFSDSPPTSISSGGGSTGGTGSSGGSTPTIGGGSSESGETTGSPISSGGNPSPTSPSSSPDIYDSTETPDQGVDEPGTSGGTFGNAKAPGASSALNGGFSDAMNSLCPGGSCSSGPSCSKDFCSATERFNNLLAYSIPNISINASACPALTIDLSIMTMGVHQLNSHCLILDDISGVITLLMSAMIGLNFVLIVLEA